MKPFKKSKYIKPKLCKSWSRSRSWSRSSSRSWSWSRYWSGSGSWSRIRSQFETKNF